VSAVCPNGHNSDSTDYCDVCGTPIPEGAVTPGSAPSSGGAPGGAGVGASGGGSANSLDLPPVGGAGGGGSASGSGPKDCPNCHTPNVADSLFCEACGYDFTTGALPAGAEPNAEEAAAPTEAGGEDGEGSPEVAAPDAGASVAGGGPVGGGSAVGASAGVGVPPRIPFQWVAEVWIDPDWYADQESADPLPSAGLPVVVPLRIASALIGRRSASRNILPDIDCSADPGVSRRHAQLTTDGSRWFVEDLQSSNGTYVGPASGPLPDDPIAVGPKTEVGDNRIYVGAWTRVVVRRATDEEIAIG
jgi:hypothetical protein